MNLGSDPGEKLSVPNTAHRLSLLRVALGSVGFGRRQIFLFRSVARAALETVCYKPPRLSCSKIVCTVRDGLHHHFSIRRELGEAPPPRVGLLLKPASLMARRPIGDRAMTGAERQRKRRARLRREREEAAKKAGKPPDPSLSRTTRPNGCSRAATSPSCLK